MQSRSCAWLIGALLALAVTAPAQQPVQSGGVGRAAAGQRRYHWSRYSTSNDSPDRKYPTAEELVPRFDLEPLGPQGPDRIEHYRHRRTGMLFVFVPGGPFPMGSNHGEIYGNIQIADSAGRGSANQDYFDSEQPQALIHVSPFFIGVYEATNAEYRLFLEDLKAGKVGPEVEWPLQTEHGDHVPALWQRTEFPFWGDRQPVVGITWLDAWAFARWMGGRLPTEAEWEKAARGTDARIWPWGNTFDPMRANTAESNNRRTLDVGTYPGGRSPFGCYDMAGNVAEYCLDAFDDRSYRERPTFDPGMLERDPAHERRVVRGGRWNRFGVLHTARCAGRGQIMLKTRYPTEEDPREQFPLAEYLGSGVRVVLSPLDDVFPDGAVEKIKSQYAAVAEARRQARERRRLEEEGGAPPDPDPHAGDEKDGKKRGK